MVREVVNGTVVGEEDDADQDDQIQSTPYTPGNCGTKVVTKINTNPEYIDILWRHTDSLVSTACFLE